MISELIQGVLIAGGFFIFALLIQFVGTLFSDWRTHKRKIKYMMIEKRLDYSELLAKKLELQCSKFQDLFNELLIKKDNKNERDKLCKNIEGIKEYIPVETSVLYFKDNLVVVQKEILNFLGYRGEIIKLIKDIENTKGNIENQLHDVRRILEKAMRKSFDIQRKIKPLIES